MLAQAVRSNLRDINNLKMRTKATSFGRLFQIASPVTDNEPELEDALFEIIEDEVIEESISENCVELEVEDEINEEDYVIVENPDQVVVQFPVISNIQVEQKLPFFKSISLKLASL